MKTSLFRGMSANLFGGLMPMAVTLLVTPLYIHSIGLERFGVLSLVWLLLGYLGFFDLGFGRAVASRVAQLDDEGRRADLLWTALVLSIGSGAAGAILAAGVGFLFFGGALHPGGSMGGEMKSGLPILAAILPLVTTSSVLAGYLQGRHMFARLNVAQTAGMIFFQVFPLVIALLVSKELQWLAVGAFAGRFCGLVFLAAYCVADSASNRRISFNRGDIRPMLNFGGWVMLSGILSQVMMTMDRMIMGAILNVQAVAVYSLPYNIIIRATLIPYSWFSVLYPRFAAANEEDAKDLLSFGGRILLLVMTPIVVAGVVVIRPFLELWIGKDLALAASPSGVILMAGFWFYAQSFMPLAFFQARGDARRPALIYAFEFVIFMPVLYALISWLGLIGAAAAWSLRAVVDAGLLYGSAGRIVRYIQTVLIGAPAIGIALSFELWAWSKDYYYLGKVALIALSVIYVGVLLTSSEVHQIKKFVAGLRKVRSDFPT